MQFGVASRDGSGCKFIRATSSEERAVEGDDDTAGAWLKQEQWDSPEASNGMYAGSMFLQVVSLA